MTSHNEMQKPSAPGTWPGRSFYVDMVWQSEKGQRGLQCMLDLHVLNPSTVYDGLRSDSCVVEPSTVASPQFLLQFLPQARPSYRVLGPRGNQDGQSLCQYPQRGTFSAITPTVAVVAWSVHRLHRLHDPSSNGVARRLLLLISRIPLFSHSLLILLKLEVSVDRRRRKPGIAIGRFWRLDLPSALPSYFAVDIVAFP